MKNWKKWLVAGCMAALLGIGTMGTTAMAMGGGGVDRSEAVAEEEKVPSGKATQNSRVSSKAWKKINGVCYNGSGQKLKVLSHVESMFLSGRIPSTGARSKNLM